MSNEGPRHVSGQGEPTGGVPGNASGQERSYGVDLYDHFTGAVTGVRRGISGIPTASVSTVITNFTENLTNVAFLPRDSSVLRPIYSNLRRQLLIPSEEGEFSNDQLARGLMALSVVSSLLHQNEFPLRDREGQSDFDADLLNDVETVLARFERSEESGQARGALQASAEAYMGFLNDRIIVVPETPDQARTQANRMHTMLSRVSIDHEHIVDGFPEWRNRVGGILRIGVGAVAQTPYATQLLLSGEFADLHHILRGETFTRSMWRLLDSADTEAPQTLQKLAKFYLGDPGLRRDFLDSVYMDNLEGFEGINDFFLTHSSEMARNFITSSIPDGETNEVNEMNIRRLVGIIADFQNRNPDHKNLRTIRRTLTAIAEERDMVHITEPAMQVLIGDTPGTIFSSQNGGAWVRTMKPEESWADFQTRTAENRVGTRRALFDSPRPADIQVVAAAEVSLAAVEIVDFTQPAELSAYPAQLEITREPAPEGFRWPDAQRVRHEDIPRVLEHLQGQLQLDPARAEALLDQILVTKGLKDRGTNPTLLLRLLPDTDTSILYPLHALGVVSVESSGGVFTIVLDAETAKISSSGPSRILLQGRLGADNNLRLEGAPREFADTPLHLLLTEAARTTIRTHGTELSKGKNSQRVKRKVDEYNAGVDPRLSPRIKIDVTGKIAERDAANAVLVPLGNDFAVEELDWEQVAA